MKTIHTLAAGIAASLALTLSATAHNGCKAQQSDCKPKCAEKCDCKCTGKCNCKSKQCDCKCTGKCNCKSKQCDSKCPAESNDKQTKSKCPVDPHKKLGDNQCPSGPHKKLCKKFDKDGDGKLCKKERKAARKAMKKHRAERKAAFIKKYDTNGDGKLCKQEKKAAHEAIAAKRKHSATTITTTKSHSAAPKRTARPKHALTKARAVILRQSPNKASHHNGRVTTLFRFFVPRLRQTTTPASPDFSLAERRRTLLPWHSVRCPRRTQSPSPRTWPPHTPTRLPCPATPISPSQTH